MKINIRKVALVILVVMLVPVLCACNRTLIDTTYYFDRAIITLPNGEVIDGEVSTWRDFEGDQIQVRIDGKTYLTHVANVVLIAE